MVAAMLCQLIQGNFSSFMLSAAIDVAVKRTVAAWERQGRPKNCRPRPRSRLGARRIDTLC